MLGYVRHQRSLVPKGKRIPPSPSPSPPVTVVVTTSPDTSPTELFSEERLRQLMQSMFRDLMPASICTNPSSTAPPAVPDSATKYTEATGGLQSVTPFEAPMMESPGVVLPTTQVDLPPPPPPHHTVSVSVPFVDSSGLSNLGGHIISCVGLPINVSRGTGQLRVANVASVASVFSPGSLLFPFSDSGFASLSASSSRPFALPTPPPLSSSVALSSSSVSALASSSFSSSLPFSPSLPPPPSFPSQLTPLPSSSSFPSSSSASAALLPPPGFPPLPPPPGFAPLSPPLSSSSFPSASAFPSLSSSLPPRCVSFSAGVSPPVLSASSASSSFPPMDFASYQASMLSLSQDYQSLARWYSLSGGSDFRAYLSAFYPHLSSDASRDFSSGSSVFFSALRAVASSVPLPAVSSAPPPLPSVAQASSSQASAPPPLPAPVSAPSGGPVPPFSLPPVSQSGGGLYAVGAPQAPQSVPSSSSSFSAASPVLSVPHLVMPQAPLPASRPQGVSSFHLHASSLPAASLAWPVSSAPGVGSSPGVSLASGVHAVPPLHHPGFPAASALPPACSASLGSTAGLSGFTSTPAGSTFGFAGPAPPTGPPPAFHPLSGHSVPPSAPPLSEFDTGADDAFAPGFGDPNSSGAVAPDPGAPTPSPLSDSARAEVRRMYQYLVDLFPQSAGSSPAPLPPRALFEEFFAAAPSPHQPVFLSWFGRVQSTLSDADARILALLAFGRPESSLLPPRLSQYLVGGGSASGSAAQVNPSLLAMFERPLRPSLHLGLTLREASLLESSSRALSEAQSHAMWLLSGLLGFVRLQGFSPSDSQFFNTLSLRYPSVWPIKPLCLLLSRLLWVSRGVNFISLISLLTFRTLINALCLLLR